MLSFIIIARRRGFFFKGANHANVSPSVTVSKSSQKTSCVKVPKRSPRRMSKISSPQKRLLNTRQRIMSEDNNTFVLISKIAGLFEK